MNDHFGKNGSSDINHDMLSFGYATRWKKLKEVRKAMDPEAAAAAPAGV